MSKPTFSVIMPTYNAGDALLRAVQSVLGQTFGDWELIVVDDGSTDGSVERVKNNLDVRYDVRVRFLAISHSGSPVAPRNRGVEESGGGWLAFLDADDWWDPIKLEAVDEQIRLTQKYFYPCALYYHDLLIIGGGRDRLWSGMSRCHSGLVFGKLIVKNFIPTSSVVLRRDAWRPMDPVLRVSHDWDLWLDVAGRGERVKFIPQVLGALSLHGGSVVTDVRRRRAESREVVRRHRHVLGPVWASGECSSFSLIWATARYYLVEVVDLWRSLTG